MDLSQWVLSQFDDTVERLRAQVLDLVPPERRREQPGGGNSILWGCFHLARHADLALAVVAAEEPAPPAGRLALGPVAATGGNGLQEAEPSWAGALPPEGVDTYLGAVVARVRQFLSAAVPSRLELVPDVQPRLTGANIDAGDFAWFYKMWQGQPVAFFVRWPLIGHIANHTGEMIATRDRMGLSPF